MAEPNIIYKITVLAMLDKVDFPLSNTQISNFFLDYSYTDYFTIQLTISRLLDSGLIFSHATHKSTLYRMTSLGVDTLKYFVNKITPAIEDDLISYFQANQMELKKENSILANFYKSTEQGFDVRCQFKEKNLSVIDLTIHVGTKTQAEAVCSNWQKQHMDIYAYLMDTLIR